jgi:hypothetical protein
VPRPVEEVREVALGDRHPDGVRSTLPERPRRGLDARRLVPLGVARRAAAPLPELLQIVQREVVAEDVQERVQERRAVARRQHEAIAIEPLRRARIVLQVLMPQHVRERGAPERQPWMSGIRLLHGVDRERADGVDREQWKVGRHRRPTLARR